MPEAQRLSTARVRNESLVPAPSQGSAVHPTALLPASCLLSSDLHFTVCIVFLFSSCPCPLAFLLFLREQQELEKPPLGPKLEPFVPPLVSSVCSSVFSEVPQADTDMVLNPAKGARSQHQSKAVKAHYYYYYYVFFPPLCYKTASVDGIIWESNRMSLPGLLRPPETLCGGTEHRRLCFNLFCTLEA